jgi:hypothetical protein
MPSIVVDTPGIYTISLVVNDGIEDSVVDTVSITVENLIPVADAGPDQAGQVGDMVTLDGSASFDRDQDALSFSWSLTSRPAGSTATLSSAGTVTPSFTIDVAGDYEVELVVSDGTQQSDPDTVRVSTVNTRPVANAGPDQAAERGDAVSLDGSASTDVDNDELSFAWRFLSRPSGSAATLSNSTGARPQFTVDVPGDFVLQLTVSDGTAVSDPDEMTVSTTNSRPVADAGPDRSAAVGESVQLDGSASNDANGDEITFSWAFTSRPTGSTASLNDPTAVTPSFTLDRAGDYVLRLVVNDGLLASNPDSVRVSTTNAPPVADAGQNLSAFIGDLVRLDGSQSSDPDGDELTYIWSFTSRPAGSQAVLSNRNAVSPTFALDVRGDYLLQLIVSDGAVNSPPDTLRVSTENTAPVADAGANQSRPLGGLVTLDGSGSSDEDGDSLTYSWNFTSRPAGSSAALLNSSGVNPRFTIDVAGTYVVRLVVGDDIDSSAPDTVTISTANGKPVARAGADQTRSLGDTVVLNGSASSDPDEDELTFRWSFTSRPSGSSAALDDAGAVSPRFTLDAPGTYVVRLVVNDGTTDSDPDTVVIDTENSPPVANAGPDLSASVGSDVMLNATNSSDVDGDTLTYNWRFTSRPTGSTATLDDPSRARPTFEIDVAGTYVLQVTVSDGLITSNPDTVRVTTENAAPVANAGPDVSRLLGQTAVLDGTSSSDPDGDALTYTWSFTSRATGSTATLENGGTNTAQFRIDVPGVYVVQLVVNDGTQNSAPDTVTVTTLNTAPTANAGPDLSVAVDQAVQLDGRDSSDPDGDDLSYRWTITNRPGGSSSPLTNAGTPQPSITPDVAGTYLLQLIVNDGTTDSAPDSLSLTAQEDDPDPCPVAPAAPSGVSASDGTSADRVTVTWNRVTDAVAYRVWRATSNNVNAASPVSGWIDGTLYNDLSAPAPTVTETGGCNSQTMVDFNSAFYWVQARFNEECEGDLGGPDEGYRGAPSKAATDLGPVVVKALPGTVVDIVTRAAGPEDSLYIRVTSPEGDIQSVWGEVVAPDRKDDAVKWVGVDPDSAADGWVAYDPETPWTVGDRVDFTVNAETSTGLTLGPLRFTYAIVASDKGAAAAGEGVHLMPYTAEDVTVLDGGAGIPYALAPEQAFESPERIWLPVPEGVDPATLTVYYHVADGVTHGWYAADTVQGWMVPGSLQIHEEDDGAWIGLSVTHGGVVQLGTVANPAAQAGVVSHAGLPEFLILVIVLLIFLVPARRMAR